MSRINYPETFLRLINLFSNINARHDALGADSPLIPFLAKQEIDIEADQKATNSAKTKDKLFDEKEREAEKLTMQRDKLFNPIFGWMKKEVQFLKKFYVGNLKELGDWGVTVNKERIVYPPEFEKLVQLFKDIKTMHESFAPVNTSPLQPFLHKYDIDLDEQLKKVNDADTSNNLRNQAQRDAEDLREDRDNLFKPVLEHIRLIGQYLKGLNIENTKELGDWGYEVDDNPRDPKYRETTIAPGTTKVIRGLKLNTQAENIGSTDLMLYQGAVTIIRAAATETHNLPPEMRLTIKRGWGTITVENQNPTTEGKIGYITTNIG
jgi:hypothetical protein